MIRLSIIRASAISCIGIAFTIYEDGFRVTNVFRGRRRSFAEDMYDVPQPRSLPPFYAFIELFAANSVVKLPGEAASSSRDDSWAMSPARMYS